MTLLGHLFPKHWFIFYIDVLQNEFLAIFLLHVPLFSLSCCSGEAFQPAVSAARLCMRDVKWSLWDANDFCVVGGWGALHLAVLHV